MSVFARLQPRLQDAIVARLGWTSLRPVQEEAGEALLDGKNAVVLAPTAGGKTEASMFPVLSDCLTNPPRGLAVIYVAPIKALLNNQAERLGTYTEMVGLDRFVWHGDVGSSARKRFLAEPTELLLTTPESLEVMLISPKVDGKQLFGDLRVVIVDEIHAMAGTDRGAHFMSVLERAARFSRHDVQRVGLSATVGNPEQILGWLAGSSRREGVVVNPPAPPARREILVVGREDVAAVARDASTRASGGKSLFFCQSRATAEAVADRMRFSDVDVFVHHSSVSKEEREAAEERFNRGRAACIVCTSTLELGIDVGDLDKVLQAEAPDTVSSFMQRMGRTGRRPGKAANTTFFCTNADSVLLASALVTLAKEKWVESVPVLDRCWPVLVHQVFAMSLARGGVTPGEVKVLRSAVPDFAGITEAELDRLLGYMLRDRSLEVVDGRYVLGPKAERRYGRKNFMELYSVFSSPQTYTVVTTSGQPLGSLQQDFVDRLVDGTSTFLLGGRAWSVFRVSHGDRRVMVVAAGRGKKPTWGGYIPQFLGFEVCQRILELLCSEAPLGFLHSSAAEWLKERREELAGVLEPGRGGFEVDHDEVRWWTFAGGRINSTLKYALSSLGHDWTVVSHNFAVKVRADDLEAARVLEGVEELRDPEYWETPGLWEEIASSLPAYRLSKFDDVLPPWGRREMVASFLLDVEGAWRVVSGEEGRGAVADALREALRAAGEGDVGGEPVPAEEVEYAKPRNPIRWVDTAAGLQAAVDVLMAASVVGLDVETTLNDRALCLVQVATAEETFLIDALAIPDLAPLGGLLASEDVVKVIHNAEFERSVLGRLGFEIRGVIDTLEVSRERRGRDAAGGHGLAAVCARELGIELDKREQCSRWRRRPLTEEQVAYAALDAEVLVRLGGRFDGWRDSDSLVPS